jgi:hypothetical protein
MKTNFISIITLWVILFTFSGCDKDSTSNGASTSSGTGGSLARFIVVGDYLYVVDHKTLITYSLNSVTNVEKVNQIDIGFNIETIYNLEDKLFIGSQDALYIYSITQPQQPEYLSSAQHLRACDPVVANEQYAYVTIRSSFNDQVNRCGGNTNALVIYDVTNITNPIRKQLITLFNPRGLALNYDVLYVCDATEGLKIFKTEDLTGINPKPTVVIDPSNTLEFNDCISYDNYLYAQTNMGFRIYDISTPLYPKYVGQISL